MRRERRDIVGGGLMLRRGGRVRRMWLLCGCRAGRCIVGGGGRGFGGGLCRGCLWALLCYYTLLETLMMSMVCDCNELKTGDRWEMCRDEMRGKYLRLASSRRPIYLILDDPNPEIPQHVPNFLHSLIHLHHTSTSLVSRYGKRNRF